MAPVNNNAHIRPVIDNHHITPFNSHRRSMIPLPERPRNPRSGIEERRNIAPNRSTDFHERHANVNTFCRHICSVTNRAPSPTEYIYMCSTSTTTPEYEPILLSSPHEETRGLEPRLNENLEDVLAEGANLASMAQDVHESLQARETVKLPRTTKCRIATSLCSVIGLGLGFMGGYFACRQFNAAGNQELMLNSSFSPLPLKTNDVILPSQDAYNAITGHNIKNNLLFERIRINTPSTSAVIDNTFIAPRNDNQILISQWEAWAANTQIGMEERRDIALNKLKNCLKHQINILRFTGLNLTDLPDNWPVHVKILVLDRNRLTQLPKALPIALERLDVNNNQLSCLPEDLPSTLEALHVWGNRLVQLPNNLPQTLGILHVGNNRLDQLPLELPPNLGILNIKYNQFRYLPENLPNKLKGLYVSGNQLTYLPKILPARLKELDIDHNQFTSLSESLPDTIERLNIGANQLAQLPKKLPSKLSRLFAPNNQLSGLPEDLPTTLIELYVSYNQLTHLPKNLPCRLIELNVSHNKLIRLPENLPPTLEVLYATYNNLTRRPKNLPTTLSILDISNNPFLIDNNLGEKIETLN